MISASTRALAQSSPLSPLAAPPEPLKASLPIAPTPQNRTLLNGGPLKGGPKGGIMPAAFGLPRACCCAQTRTPRQRGKRTVLRAALVGCARGLRWTSGHVVVPCRSRGRRYPDIGGVQPPEVGANRSGISPSFFSPPFGDPSLRQLVVPCVSRVRRYSTGGGFQPTTGGVTSRRAGAKGKFRASGFNLKHAVGLSESFAGAKDVDTPPSKASSRETVGYSFNVKMLFLELIKRRTCRFFPYRKLVLSCF